MSRDSRPPALPFDLDAEAMRRSGYAAIDLLVERWATLRDQPPWRTADRATMEGLLLQPAPEAGAGVDAAPDLLRRLATNALEYAGRIDHPRFVGFIPSSPTWAAVLGDLLASGYNVFQGTWLESAGPSEIELVVLDWFRAWLGLPTGGGGLLLSGGSAANLTAIVVARDARLGAADPAGVIYASDQVHSSIERAARILGFTRERVRLIPSDDGFGLPPDALEAAVSADAAAGLRPFLVVANAGATSTGAIDPLPELADLCARHALWLHVDGAYGGFAALTNRGSRWLRGIERADSVTLDPHKWLFQTYETGCLLVREPGRLEQSFHVAPDYLQDVAVLGREVNFADRGIQLTRMARALKVWLSIQLFGTAAFRQAIDAAIDLAAGAERRIQASAELELLAPAALGVVCFRRRPPGVSDEQRLEALNARILQRLNEDGTAMMSSTRIRGRYALRLCIMNWRTTADDVAHILDAVQTAPAEA